VERQCQCGVHGILETVVTGEPQLLDGEPGGPAEAGLQPLHRVQAVGQAPEDPDGAARFVRRKRAVSVGVRVYQVGGMVVHSVRLIHDLQTFGECIFISNKLISFPSPVVVLIK